MKYKYVNSDNNSFNTSIADQETSLYVLNNKNGLEMAVTNFGARVVELWVPDRDGNFEDIVLGHSTINEYIDYRGERFLGATIGRFGNRIADGKFTLDGNQYILPTNEKNNTLHGGTKGFDMVVWKTKQINNQEIVFHYISEDGEQGFPGKLEVSMKYELTDDNEFKITYSAKTDKVTVINLTHHSFFNLKGQGNGSINDHLLTINADYFTPVDSLLIPTGDLAIVSNTPMDFRKSKRIGNDLNVNFDQLILGKGYDHNWVINEKEKEITLAASVFEPESGRFLEVFSDEPGIQFYGGNFFDGSTSGKKGKVYKYREAFALETQHFPDSPNQPSFPTTVLKPAEEYQQVCIYKFSTK